MVIKEVTVYDIGSKIYPVTCEYKYFDGCHLPEYKASKTPDEVRAIEITIKEDSRRIEYMLTDFGRVLESWAYPTWEKAYERVCYLNRGLPNE